MRKFVVAVITSLVMLGGAGTASATGDQSLCPGHEIKWDGLKGYTVTAPQAPSGWEIYGASVKAGNQEYWFDVVSGQTIDIRTYTKHEISHVHWCKRRPQVTTTTSTTTTTTSTTTTTIPEETTTSTTSPTTTSTTSTVPSTSTTTVPESSTSTTLPATTTTVIETTTTSSPTTTSPTSLPTTSSTTPPTTGVSSTTVAASTTSVALTTPPVPTRNLPETGENTGLLALIGLGLLGAGGLSVFAARRK